VKNVFINGREGRKRKYIMKWINNVALFLCMLTVSAHTRCMLLRTLRWNSKPRSRLPIAQQKRACSNSYQNLLEQIKELKKDDLRMFASDNCKLHRRIQRVEDILTTVIIRMKILEDNQRKNNLQK
jgi:hypothetical protein